MQLKWPMRWDLFSLFPAYAGVIPFGYQEAWADYPFPRIRGGDPIKSTTVYQNENFSPHTRG